MGRRSTLSGVSVHELHKELRRRQRRAGSLERRRASLARKLSALDAEIGSLGGSFGRNGRLGGGRRRARNSMSLVEALSKTLSGKTMSVTEVAAAVQRAGYRTTSPSFRTIVNQALISNSGKFRRVERGQYTAK